MTPSDLTAWRKRLGLSKVRAAEALGVNRNTVADYEAGRYPIPRYIELACCYLEEIKQQDRYYDRLIAKLNKAL